ncbi:MAG: PAS domain-containing protein [Bacteroidota bacterium]
MHRFFSIPDKEKDFQSHMLYVLSVLWTVVTVIICITGLMFRPDSWGRWVALVATALFAALITHRLNRPGHIRLASWFFTIMLWLMLTVPCYSAGGIMAPGILAQTSVILTAGFLLGWRGGLGIGLLTIGADFWLVYLELTGKLPTPVINHNAITRWVGAIIPFGTILALQYYTTNHLRFGLTALRREIAKRMEAEKITDHAMHDLKERVKELKTLYTVSNILQDEETPLRILFYQIAEALPPGWHYPEITAARICFAGTEYATGNFRPSAYCQRAEITTDKGSVLLIEVVYLEQSPELDEGPFLHEERHLINMLADMIKLNLDRRERNAELKDYKHALDLSYMISICGADERFTYVNDNFCKASKYSPAELLGNRFDIIMSGYHPPEYFIGLATALRDGKPFRGEFCDKAKDGTLFWVDSTVVPFLDNNGKVYQYLSINHDITERKEADDKIKQSERLLKKITSQIPGNTYMFEIEESGYSNILFISRGKDIFNHSYDLDELAEHPEMIRDIVYEDDKIKFNDRMKEAWRTQLPISFQYRIVVDGNIRWRWMQAVPEKDKNGKIYWYGATSDITPLIDYIASVEQIIFDIGHVIRRPLSSMLGMSRLIADGNLPEKDIHEISLKLNQVSEEMDKFITELNNAYQQKRQSSNHNIDIPSIIDKRSSLFN